MPSYPHSPQAPEGPHILTRRLEDQRKVKTKLVNLVSRMGNLKLIAATGDRRQCPNIEVLGDAQSNITVYELWDTGDPDGVDFHIKEEE
ncbi:hypothetical protein MJG53_020173 [Ovis ammon polii x Ovis aries]|uniref:Uncharacterized protein n=1 Tax=Ovis ammon polii x Ovis aries TaxID=2918886 RepID=A0ACB9U2F9_9CETA|nr:hypothetical protein MJG53_020173 [Ovis ammon polii x Ovis aries]